MAIDETGIYLAEVKNRYPVECQPLGYDVLLDTDNMYKPKVISTFELCVNSILTLLFMKPGQYPSIPDLGIDIESYLHEYHDDPTIPSQIKTKLNDQCNRIGMAGVTVDVSFDKTSDGFNALLIQVDGTERLAIGHPSDKIIIGITYDKLNRLYTRKGYASVRDQNMMNTL